MSDGDIVKIARMMDRLNRQQFNLLKLIEESNHPCATAIAKALFDEFMMPAEATHIIRRHLEHPENWRSTETGITFDPGAGQSREEY